MHMLFVVIVRVWSVASPRPWPCCCYGLEIIALVENRNLMSDQVAAQQKFFDSWQGERLERLQAKSSLRHSDDSEGSEDSASDGSLEANLNHQFRSWDPGREILSPKSSSCNMKPVPPKAFQDINMRAQSLGYGPFLALICIN